jgi:MFS family permease
MTELLKNKAGGTLIAALATIGVCDIAFGLTFQLQPLLLEAQGVPAWLIGLNVAMGPLGILLIGPFLPRLISHYGSKSIAVLAILTIATALLAMSLLPPLYWWFLFRFFLGMAIGTLFTVSETWMVAISNEENRGRIMGIYTSMLSVTFAIGPMLLPFTGIQGIWPWAICIVCVLAGLLPLLLVNIREVSEEGGKGSVLGVLKKQPLLFACIGAATLFDGVLISFFTIYGTKHGLPLGEASTLLGTGIIAGVVFFYPLGLWADRWSKNGVVMLCSLATIAAAFAMIALINTPAIWLVMIVLSTSAFGVYVVALAMIGDAFKGKDVVAGSAAVAAMWGMGGIIGPPIAGRLIDAFGYDVFPYVLAGFYTLLTLLLLLNGGRVLRHVEALDTAPTPR